jgi:hypothetical protein
VIFILASFEYGTDIRFDVDKINSSFHVAAGCPCVELLSGFLLFENDCPHECHSCGQSFSNAKRLDGLFRDKPDDILKPAVSDEDSWFEDTINDSIQFPGASDRRDSTGVHESDVTIDLAVPEYFYEVSLFRCCMACGD